MPKQPQIRVDTAKPLNAKWRDLDLAEIEFEVPNGDRFLVLLSRDELGTLQRHIQQLFSQTLFQPGPPEETQ